MRRLAGFHRGKACFACIHAKRRCDKALPACKRCVERESQCHYPTTRPYTRQSNRTLDTAKDDAPRSAPIESPRNTFQTYSTSTFVDPIDLSAVEEWNGDSLQFLESGDAFNFNSLDESLVNNLPWYALPENWDIHMCDLGDFRTGIPLSALQGFVDSIRRWLQQWVNEGHCPFIHRELYGDTTLPTCLQDAYATWTAYSNKNNRNQELVMQLVGARAEALAIQLERFSHGTFQCIQAGQAPSLSRNDVKSQLAHVQALIVYQFIQLFDGHIRQRADAEKRMAISKSSRTQLWKLTKSCMVLAPIDFNLSCKWRDWILTESIRRSWIVSTYMQSAYLALRDGQGECPGSISCTLRRGLWDATSASTWSRLINAKGPLFMRCDPPNQLFNAASEAEVDDFARSVVAIVWDTEILESWTSIITVS